MILTWKRKEKKIDRIPRQKIDKPTFGGATNKQVTLKTQTDQADQNKKNCRNLE